MTADHEHSEELAEEAVSDLTDDLARGAAETGADVAVVAEVFLAGLLRARKSRGSARLLMIKRAAECFVLSALDEGLDPCAAAQGLVRGAEAWCRETGAPATIPVAMAEQGAIDAAEGAGQETGRRVRETLRGRPGWA